MSSPEESLDDNTPRAKREFLKQCGYLQKELEKRQREYKNVLSVRLQNRSEQIIEKSYPKTISRLHSERKDLRAQIWVAGGKSYTYQNDCYLRLVKCQVRCQEKLTAEIQTIKTDISHLEHDISSVDKNIYKLNLKTVPDEQHQDFVKQMRKKMSLLENRLEVGIRRECGFTAANAKLREELKSLLENREFFNNWYTKLIHKLNTEKKYLLDLMKYAFNTFEDCNHFQDKIINTIKKMVKEDDRLKDEMQSKLRKSANADSVASFLDVKNKTRSVANLQPKEIQRRTDFVHVHSRKINLYNRVLGKLLEYTSAKGGIKSVNGIIDIFMNQENLYYSYCTIANEIGFHITLLNDAVNQLYEDIDKSKIDGHNRTIGQIEKIAKLESILSENKKKNEQLKNELRIKENNLQIVFENVADIFNMCNCNVTPLTMLLGNHTQVNLHNMRKFFQILEKRVLNIVSSVYFSERRKPNKTSDTYVVKDIFKILESLTDLNDIVIAQQCPECAEGEAFNTDNGDNGVRVYSKTEATQILYEKVNQPEMQYRLHSISQCRLPRSRLLTAKRTAE